MSEKDGIKEIEAPMQEARKNYRILIDLWQSRTGNSFIPWAMDIPDNLLKDAKLVQNREKFLEQLPKNGIAAEVGTQTGHFAAKIFSISSPSVLHVFDIDYSLFNDELLKIQVDSGKCVKHLGDSSEKLSEFPENFFDWIYIAVAGRLFCTTWHRLS